MPEGSEVTNTDGNKVDVLSLSTIQSSLQRIAQRVNYGVETGPEDETVPPVREMTLTLVSTALALGSAGLGAAPERES